MESYFTDPKFTDVRKIIYSYLNEKDKTELAKTSKIIYQDMRVFQVLELELEIQKMIEKHRKEPFDLFKHNLSFELYILEQGLTRPLVNYLRQYSDSDQFYLNSYYGNK